MDTTRIKSGDPGCPAHAGMLLERQPAGRGQRRLPRTRGDAPPTRCFPSPRVVVAPHTRGCSSDDLVSLLESQGCPAHAGMLPPLAYGVRPQVWLPRTRGDAPRLLDLRFERVMVAPHTRGCSHPTALREGCIRGCPAHAGMLPTHPGAAGCASRLPRTRGDAPHCPRLSHSGCQVAPHTRGCSYNRRAVAASNVGCPAHAGMLLGEAIHTMTKKGLPRTRGDAPRTSSAVTVAVSVAPHTRGCSLFRL